MALATKCPHCQTTFRVAHDQLKLRAGLVRCGHCKEIFNGIEHLLRPDVTSATAASASALPAAVMQPSTDDAEQTAAPDAIESSVTESSAMPSESIDTESEIDADASSEPVSIASEPKPSSKLDFELPAHFERDPDASPFSADDAKPVDPLQRMTLVDFTRDLPDSIEGERDVTSAQECSNAEERLQALDPAVPDELDEAIEDLQRKPWRRNRKKTRSKDKADAPDDHADAEDEVEEEPSFVKHGRRRQQLGRKWRIFLATASCILFLAAIAQGAYIFRNQIAGLFPPTKPFLTQACDLIGCRINLPAQITAVSIESSELQTLEANQNAFVLTTLLRNDSNTLQEWPCIELTLNDGNEKALLRRVFKPVDYLGNADQANRGFPPNSEHAAHLSFEVAQLKASGYRVYLFYP